MTFNLPGEWAADALCAQVDPDIFHPEDGRKSGQAKKICRGCDVTVQCLAYAMDNDMREGVWGGLSAFDRSVLRPVGVFPYRTKPKP